MTDNNVAHINGDSLVLEEVAKQSPLYIIGEGVFRNQEELEASRAAHGKKPYVPPLADMGYTPTVLNYFKKPINCSDKDLWTLY
ncbi:hypothetical protein HOC13_00625 [Candidatus Woesearchaeota archaeon]|nr:hypothetical protein [Candidatus Woesearchaeota archaeon]